MKFFSLFLLLLLSTNSFAKKESDYERAIFAGGCFWCMEPPFDDLDGVISTISGYIGGSKVNPSYQEISTGKTGHAEVVEITYDPKKISYSKLLEVFWKNIDPTVKDRQFCDQGSQYRSAIFYLNSEQEKIAQKSLGLVRKKGIEPIHTEIVQATEFYRAEDYHQDYYQKNPARYKYYRSRCGRDKRLKEIWQDIQLQFDE